MDTITSRTGDPGVICSCRVMNGQEPLDGHMMIDFAAERGKVH